MWPSKCKTGPRGVSSADSVSLGGSSKTVHGRTREGTGGRWGMGGGGEFEEGVESVQICTGHIVSTCSTTVLRTLCRGVGVGS